jgi:hypothetical protein
MKNVLAMFIEKRFPLKGLSGVRFLSSASTHRNGKDWGTVEGVWVFHRHGDRTPARSLVADHMHEKEAAFWETKVPPIDKKYFKAFCKAFPVSIHESNNQGQFLDTRKAPYGFLTWKGMDQMKAVGESLAKRYNPTNGNWHDEWDFQCFSTNYLRTTMSLQCLLDGMIGLSKDDRKTYQSPLSSSQTSYENVSAHHIIENAHGKNQIPIQVRDRRVETLNAFDKYPEIMKSLVQDIVGASTFIDKDGKAGFLAARLANFLPGLAATSSYGGPSGINWIHAADHFVCRSAHATELSRFLHLHNDPVVEQTLKAMWYPTITHLAWRFRQWYQNLPLLAALAGPPLKEIEKEMIAAIASPSSRKKVFRIYSCHDVTILGLLYGINVDFLATEERLKENGINGSPKEKWRFWPEYASNITFELVRAEDISESGRYFVRILLNGEPVRVLSTREKDKSSLSVSTFSNLVDELQSHCIIEEIQSEQPSRTVQTA